MGWKLVFLLSFVCCVALCSTVKSSPRKVKSKAAFNVTRFIREDLFSDDEDLHKTAKSKTAVVSQPVKNKRQIGFDDDFDGSGGLGSLEPLDPLDPLDSLDPLDPHETFEPEEPEEPQQPQQPYYPYQPEEPEEPHQPHQPQEPHQPHHPSQPEEPEEPHQPPQPHYPYQPEETEEPEEPTQPHHPYQPEEPHQPHHPYQPEEPEEPEEPQQPYYPYQPEEPEEPHYPPYVPHEPEEPEEPHVPYLPHEPEEPEEPDYQIPHYPEEPEEPEEPVESPDNAVEEYPESHGGGYVPISLCGSRYYCRTGGQGPCGANEVFSSTAPGHSPQFTCANIAALWTKGCYPTGTSDDDATALATGYCRKAYRKRPCVGYPSSYRYCKKTRRCYPCISTQTYHSPSFAKYPRRSHCGPGKAFVDVDGVYGSCRCAKPNSVMWRRTGKCYPVYTRGPCTSGNWLEPRGTGYSSCRKCPCPRQADGRHIYWNSFGRPGCYKSYTRGPCRAGRYFVINNYANRRAKCVRPATYYRYRPSKYYSYGKRYKRPRLASYYYRRPRVYQRRRPTYSKHGAYSYYG